MKEASASGKASPGFRYRSIRATLARAFRLTVQIFDGRRTMSTFHRAISYALNISICSILLGVVLVVLVQPHITNGASRAARLVSMFGILYLLALVCISIALIVLIISRKWSSAAHACASLLILVKSMLVISSLPPAEYPGADRAHRELAEIYERNRADFGEVTPAPRLIDLDQQCHPPGGGAGGCACWLLLDPGHVTGAEKEKAGWHLPNTSILAEEGSLIQLANVQRIDANTFSILGCDNDWRNWLTRLRGN